MPAKTSEKTINRIRALVEAGKTTGEVKKIMKAEGDPVSESTIKRHTEDIRNADAPTESTGNTGEEKKEVPDASKPVKTKEVSGISKPIKNTGGRPKLKGTKARNKVTINLPDDEFKALTDAAMGIPLAPFIRLQLKIAGILP